MSARLGGLARVRRDRAPTQPPHAIGRAGIFVTSHECLYQGQAKLNNSDCTLCIDRNIPSLYRSKGKPANIRSIDPHLLKVRAIVRTGQ